MIREFENSEDIPFTKLYVKLNRIYPPPPNSSPFSLAVVVGRRDSLSVPSWPSSQTSQAFCSRAPPELSGPALTCCPGYPQPTKPRQESTMTGKLRERKETYSRNGNLPSWSREFRNQCLSPKATSDPHKGLLKPRGPQLWSPSSSFEQHNRLHKPNIAQVVKTLPKRDQTVVLIRPPPRKICRLRLLSTSRFLTVNVLFHPTPFLYKFPERRGRMPVCCWGVYEGMCVEKIYIFSPSLYVTRALVVASKELGSISPAVLPALSRSPTKSYLIKGLGHCKSSTGCSR